MTIEDEPKIFNLTPKHSLTKEEIDNIKKFVIANKDKLLNLINKKINFNDFKNCIKKVVNGKIIDTEDLYKIISDKFIFNHKIIYNKDKGFNFLTKNEQILSKNIWFDEVYDFGKIKPNQIGAYVRKEEEWFILGENGGLTQIE